MLIDQVCEVLAQLLLITTRNVFGRYLILLNVPENVLQSLLVEMAHIFPRVSQIFPLDVFARSETAHLLLEAIKSRRPVLLLTRSSADCLAAVNASGSLLTSCSAGHSQLLQRVLLKIVADQPHLPFSSRTVSRITSCP